MRIIGIVGYGELGQQIEYFIKSTIEDTKFIYFDDLVYKIGAKDFYSFSSFLDSKFSEIEFIVGLGYQHLKKKKEVIYNLIENKRRLFTFVHPTAIVDASSIIDVGTVIYPNVVIDKKVQIGKGCLLNLSVTIAHDSIIDDCCFLAPSVTLSGSVRLGSMVFIGTGVNVANGVNIGSSVICGIGSVITKNIGEGQSVIGNPQKTVRKIRLT
ncbi:MAG: acetyltransferase [Bacteroidales bacterium]|nr:acetyltransferase [Bacteroidales bacterium]